MELSAKQLFDKDKTNAFNKNQDYMLGSKVSPSSNPNSYPMTDETTFPSSISIFLNGAKSMSTVLPDDPADHRGVLSWNSQLKDKKLREAGSYGYLIKVPLTQRTLQSSKQKGYLDLKIQSDNGGGIAVYGAQFGRYPVDINLVVEK
ncbi:MAG: glycoside hydrolase family 2, partial [Saprospiraceae bacterium]